MIVSKILRTEVLRVHVVEFESERLRGHATQPVKSKMDANSIPKQNSLLRPSLRIPLHPAFKLT
jgi:hypothetical protein